MIRKKLESRSGEAFVPKSGEVAFVSEMSAFGHVRQLIYDGKDRALKFITVAFPRRVYWSGLYFKEVTVAPEDVWGEWVDRAVQAKRSRRKLPRWADFKWKARLKRMRNR